MPSTPRLLRLLLPLAALSLLFTGAAGAESPNVNTPATITGNAVVGETLTAHNGTWLYLDGSACREECVMTYQWQRGSADGTTWTDISGGAGRFYAVAAADAGSRLRAMETMSKYDCNALNQDCRTVSRSAPSSPTAVVPGSASTSPPPATPKPTSPLAPAATTAPAISGVSMVDETLTATKGLWSGTGPLAVVLEWQRCDAESENCANLGIVADTYTVIPFDVGKTLRVVVTASNLAGRRTAVSETTPVVSELKPTETKTWIPASKVTAPHRLVIDRASARPQRLTRRTPLKLALRVSDDRGFRISGALVSVAALPSGAVDAIEDVETDETGLVTLTLRPTAKLNLRKPGTLTLIVSARRPGDRLTSPRTAFARVKVALRPAKR